MPAASPEPSLHGQHLSGLPSRCSLIVAPGPLNHMPLNFTVLKLRGKVNPGGKLDKWLKYGTGFDLKYHREHDLLTSQAESSENRTSSSLSPFPPPEKPSPAAVQSLTQEPRAPRPREPSCSVGCTLSRPSLPPGPTTPPASESLKPDVPQGLVSFHPRCCFLGTQGPPETPLFPQGAPLFIPHLTPHGK